MGRTLLLLLLLLLWGDVARCADMLQLRTLSPTTSQQFRVTLAAFGAALPRVSWPSSSYSRPTGQLLVNENAATPDQSRRLVQAQMTTDCSGVRPVGGDMTTLPEQAALLLTRSASCTVEQQALAAEKADASLVVIRDSVAGAFADTSLELRNEAYYDCALGEETVTTNSSVFPELADPFSAWSCSSKPACVTSTCVLTGKTTARATTRFQACCFTSSWLQLQPRRELNAPTDVATTIPVLLVAFQDGNRIDDVASIIGDTDVLVWAFNTEETPWNASMALTWMFGVLTVLIAAYYSCSEERELSYEKLAIILARRLDRSPSSSSISTTMESTAGANEYVSMDDDRLELSSKHAIYFLVGASCLLVLLYYVHLALLLSVLFAVGGSAALSHVFTLPFVARMASPSSSNLQAVMLFLVTLTAPALALCWFLARTQPWVWPIQDFMALTVCVVFIDVVRLPNLRVATSLLTAAFVYDVFFVYISPLVFGSNVMVDVASGGGSTRLGSGATDVGEVTLQPTPMVLRVPLLFSVYGGEALLGLGDIIIPGLLVAFCIRYDYCCGQPLSRGYVCAAMCAYAFGLMVANIMAIVLRDVVAGQPALMYVVPTMLVTVLGLASINGELGVMWDAPPCFRVRRCHASALEEAELEVQRQAEQRPLLAED
ncbi:Signal peptide peptidase-like 2A [Phytophthora pseudosyringae]|uniref:Signal peptide peptidase-like 2A n=1 Tax=Phytophthora pseudosyringae TaxID=221518 RepID=A0A8T1VLY0_9STRA|nr:Signal peptide peptidase-like 2A [Phytophthora pseudosyringae]